MCSSVESEDHLEGEEVRDKGTENPCCWIDGPCWVRGHPPLQPAAEATGWGGREGLCHLRDPVQTFKGPWGGQEASVRSCRYSTE